MHSFSNMLVKNTFFESIIDVPIKFVKMEHRDQNPGIRKIGMTIPRLKKWLVLKGLLPN
jgi:hypothetical protein